MLMRSVLYVPTKGALMLLGIKKGLVKMATTSESAAVFQRG